MTDTTPSLKIEGLSHRFGDKLAVDRIDWTIPHRGVVGLVGPNGAGKTTLFSLIAGFLKIQQGKVEVLGAPVPGHRSLIGRVAVMPQDAIFARDVTILDQLLFLRSLDGVHGIRARQEVEEAMERVGLEKELHRGAAVLSHGMGKRLGVAQSILGSPELILLDEPTAGLDPANAKQVRELIRELGEKALVIVSSHNLLELQDLISEIAVIVDGSMVESGSVADVTKRARRFELTLGRTPAAEEIDQLKQLPLVRQIEVDQKRITIDIDASGEEGIDGALLQLLSTMLEQELPPHQMREGASLEEAYLRLTGEEEAS